LKKRRRSRAFIYGFAGTFLVLILLFLAIYETPPAEVATESLPGTIPKYTAPWGPFVPAIALQMGFENFTMIKDANQSVLPLTAVVLNVTNPVAVIRNSDIQYHLDVAVSSPNTTYDVVFLKAASYARVSSAFTEAGQAQDSGHAVLYNVTDEGVGTIEIGYVGLFPEQNAVAFSPGQVEGAQALDIAFDTYNSTIAQMISFTSIPQLLYTVGGTGGHYAIGIQNFPGLVRTGLLTLIAVDPLPSYAQISFVVQFANPATASAQLQTMKTDYLTSHDFTVYSNAPYIKAVELTSSAGLQGAVAQVG
jgi:hypothetical protein